MVCAGQKLISFLNRFVIVLHLIAETCAQVLTAVIQFLVKTANSLKLIENQFYLFNFIFCPCIDSDKRRPNSIGFHEKYFDTSSQTKMVTYSNWFFFLKGVFTPLRSNTVVLCNTFNDTITLTRLWLECLCALCVIVHKYNKTRHNLLI